MKKKILSLMLVAVLAICSVSLAACNSDEIENGSKIERMIMTLEFYNASGEVIDTKDVQIKLYTTFAPETTAYFKKLAADGYFNGTCVSNVQSGYFEIGAYEYVNGAFTEKAFDSAKYGALKGEFEKNGWVGNKLRATGGALIFKHDSATEDGSSVSRFDTAKGTVIVCMSSTSKFSVSEYCVFGMVCSDDSDDNPSSDVSDDSLVNRSGKTSLGVIGTVSDLISNDGTRTYYYETDKVFYTRTYDDEDNILYYEGTEITSGSVALEGDALTKIKELVANADEHLLTVPYTKVVVKEIKAKG